MYVFAVRLMDSIAQANREVNNYRINTVLTGYFPSVPR